MHTSLFYLIFCLPHLKMRCNNLRKPPKQVGHRITVSHSLFFFFQISFLQKYLLALELLYFMSYSTHYYGFVHVSLFQHPLSSIWLSNH